MLRHIRISLFMVLAALALAAPAAAQATDQPVTAPVASPPDQEADTYATALVQSFPALTGRVVDAAGVLDPGHRKTLVARLEALDAATGDQLVVATVASLHGASVETYANRLFNIWKLGQRERNNGVLLLVAPGERKVRIEVGYGLEGRLTDTVAKVIVEQSIVPHFRNGDFAGGIAHAADDIAAVLTDGAGPWQARAAAASAPTRDERGLAYGQAFMYVMFAVAAAAATFGLYILGWFFLRFLIVLHLLPQRNRRDGFWRWLDKVDADLYDKHGRRLPGHSSASSASHSSASSDTSASFSGGGGASGGGGTSGSW